MADTTIRDGIIAIIKSLDRAISMEINAKRFFARAAMEMRLQPCQELFEWLSNFEDTHIDKLESKRNEFSQHHSLKGKVPEREYDRNLSEVSSVFEIKQGMSEADFIRMAITGERKMYAYYQKKRTATTDQSLKILFEQLSREEEKHWEILKKLQSHLNVGESFKSLKLKDIIGDINF